MKNLSPQLKAYPLTQTKILSLINTIRIHYIFLSIAPLLFTFTGKFARLVFSRACTGFDGDDAALEAIRKKSR